MSPDDQNGAKITGTKAVNQSKTETGPGSSVNGEHNGDKGGEKASASHGASFATLAIGSIGVVFGDIGTSPLYAFREALAHSRSVNEVAVFGVVSLVFWALILVVTVKYTVFLMRADNKGEGGTLALMALAQKALTKPSTLVLFLGLCGAALFYGDGIVTPAISVLGAIEGLKDAPSVMGVGVGQFAAPYAPEITMAILIGLFLVQSRGTGSVARWFGPITVLWFLMLAVIGILHIIDDARIFQALLPHHALRFLIENQWTSLIILGSVFLAVTGAEALYADMGHFGLWPIRLSWWCFVLPCLVLNYLGQGAFALSHPDEIMPPHAGQANHIANIFFLMIPGFMYWPVLILATMAAIIASQAVITGAFSMTQQAVQLGLLPRMEIKKTSEHHSGQIFVPQVNAILLVGVLILVLYFQSSSKLASAYGVAVTGAMLVDTLIAWVIFRRVWKWKLWQAIALTTPLLILDITFLSGNLLKFFSGAWVPVVLASEIVILMLTWRRGTQILVRKSARDSVPLNTLMQDLAYKDPPRVRGTAIFLTSDPEFAPPALLHNLKHNKILHEQNVILTVETVQTPRVADEDRYVIEAINRDFTRVALRFGFMEEPNVPKALGICRKKGLKFDIMSTSFFLGRRTLVADPNSGMPLWQDRIFIFLAKNSSNATEFFHIPTNRAVELGAQVSV